MGMHRAARAWWARRQAAWPSERLMEPLLKPVFSPTLTKCFSLQTCVHPLWLQNPQDPATNGQLVFGKPLAAVLGAGGIYCVYSPIPVGWQCWGCCSLLSPSCLAVCLTPRTTYLVTVNLILSATANILSRFCEPKVHGFLKGIPGGSPSIITDPGLLLIRLYGTCTGYLIPKASPAREK